jgi:hypothetical protein
VLAAMAGSARGVRERQARCAAASRRVSWRLLVGTLACLAVATAALIGFGVCGTRGRAACAGTNVDFHAADSASGSGELVAEVVALPPGDGCGGGQAGLAQDG